MSIENVTTGLNISLLCLALLSQVAIWLILLQVVKQQGRILLRLDDLGRSQPTELPVVQPHPEPPRGPVVGYQLAPFRLPNLTGQEMTLDDFVADQKRALLVHWSPTCGFCDLIAPELAEQHARLSEHGIELVLISHGDAVANLRLAQEHGLRCPILILPDNEVLDVFRHQGTPVACLVNTDGTVARQLAVGANEVPNLIRELIAAEKRRLPGERPLSESHIVRDGLKAGTPAPGFTLPEVRGDELSLDQYRGRHVALVFTDPHCGPCDALAPELVRLSAECREAGLELVMVSRGDIAESREKAERYGFEFPVVVQQRWEVSRAYGIFATPVAFLIDPSGVIERDVAQGVDAIVGLLQDQLVRV